MQALDQFWVIRNGAHTGPFSEAEVLRAHGDGTLRPEDRLWAEGLTAPVTVAEAFAQLGIAAAADRGLALEPVAPGRFSRERVEDARRDASPYRPPTTVLEEPEDLTRHGEPHYAGFWVRYGASMLDTLLLVAFTLVVDIAFGFLARAMGIHAELGDWLGFAISLVLIWLYIARGECGPHRATPGKRAFHLQVLHADYLDRISFLRASARFAGRYLSFALLMVGYLMQPFNRRKRALHDFLTSTVVVVERGYSRRLVALMIVLGLILTVAAIGLLAAVAVPAYRDFVVRQQVSMALASVTPATSAVERYLAQAGKVPQSLEDTGFDPSEPRPGVRRIDFEPGSGVITVTLDVEAVDGATVQIVPAEMQTASISWACRAGTLDPNLLPRQCPPGGD
jgi:uncharacterized RDD family membrane protein YckC/Tfp pilus assembly major pilin PilA